MMTPLMRASILLACLCLPACKPEAPEPDPAQVEAAAIQARRAQGEAAIRAKRAELRGQREKSRSTRQEQQKLRDAMVRGREDAIQLSRGHRDACLKARRTDPSIKCSDLGRVVPSISEQMESHNARRIP